MCGASEGKEKKNSENWKIIYTHDTAITNSQIHLWSLKIKIYMIYF